MKLLSNCLSLLLISLSAVIQRSEAEQCSIKNARFQATDSIAIETGILVDIVSISSARSLANCVLWCLQRSCAAIKFNFTSHVCQMLITLDAGKTALTGLAKVFRPEVGEKMWKMSNFDDIVERGRSGKINYTAVSNYQLFGASGQYRIGSIQFAIINTTGCYQVEASGASGGWYGSSQGGWGARISGVFNFVVGTRLAIVVGQMGGNSTSLNAPAGGGGGTFVYGVYDAKLYIAAGGGGGVSSWYQGLWASKTTRAGNSRGRNPVSSGIGGDNGQPGFNEPITKTSDIYHGGCGAGWLGKPINPRRSSDDGEEGGGMTEGWIGGRAGRDQKGSGGFGGGGGAGIVYGASGAGGGFSGGGAGLDYTDAGGGGGSFCGGSKCNFDNVLFGDGKVVLQLNKGTC